MYHLIQEDILEVVHIQQGQMLEKVEKDVDFKRLLFSTREINND